MLRSACRVIAITSDGLFLSASVEAATSFQHLAGESNVHIASRRGIGITGIDERSVLSTMLSSSRAFPFITYKILWSEWIYYTRNRSTQKACVCQEMIEYRRSTNFTCAKNHHPIFLQSKKNHYPIVFVRKIITPKIITPIDSFILSSPKEL